MRVAPSGQHLQEEEIDKLIENGGVEAIFKQPALDVVSIMGFETVSDAATGPWVQLSPAGHLTHCSSERHQAVHQAHSMGATGGRAGQRQQRRRAQPQPLSAASCSRLLS